MRDYKEEARDLIEGRVLFDAPMKRYTSIKVGGPAECLLFPKDVKELRKVIRHAGRKRIPVFILGKGTNLIVRDRGIHGWVVSLTQGMKKVKMDGEVLEAEAGCPLQQLVQFSVQKGLAGLEPFFGIPGTVGGGLAMNAGAWGTELKDVIHSVTLMKEDGEIVKRPQSRLRFTYRNLVLPPSWIILKGRFRLKEGRREEILERVKSFSEMRKRTQPLDYPSAGSVFKNPEEGQAGKWIDETGLKGFRMGQAMVSDRHANFIINLGKATAEEVLRLMEWVERRVYEEKGISLEREVRVVGEA
ncbi:MAG: UDP-N-acetylenolpyruvoylglucosamine reductase [Deltaproteobacteria bacterium RBG_16_49_23]|nr:MAG: UDP-N-acetylenolpyruvoylglucosamine reductase [Deltaproteobacteria bacterium RBG_16_49_23]